MADKIGAFNRLGYAGSGVTTATHEFEFLPGSSLGINEQFIYARGITGSRGQPSERTRRGPRQVEGQIQLAPTPVELVRLLPLILGGTPSGTSYPVGESLTLFNLFPVRDGTVYTASDCIVEQATFSCQVGSPMTLALALFGKDEAATGSMGSAAIDYTTQPFVLSDAVVTVDGSAREVDGFELTIRNFVQLKHRNSLTLTQLKATDREVTLDLPLSLGTDGGLYGSAVGGISAVIALTNGNTSLTFTMPKVQAPRTPLPLGERGILDFAWRGTARKDGSTAELATVLDSTP